MRNDCHDIENFVATNTMKVDLEDNTNSCCDNATTKTGDKDGCYNIATLLILS